MAASLLTQASDMHVLKERATSTTGHPGASRASYLPIYLSCFFNNDEAVAIVVLPVT
jgi:hypothetical protein